MLKGLWQTVNRPRVWLHTVLGLGRPHPPREVAFGLALGFGAGFGPWALHQCVPLLLIVLMRTLLPAAIGGLVAGALAWTALGGMAAGCGYWFLSEPGTVAGWVAWCGEAPVLAFFRLHHYEILGSVVLGVAIASVLLVISRLLFGLLYKLGIGKIGPWVFARVAEKTGAGKGEKSPLWERGPFRVISPGGLAALLVLAVVGGGTVMATGAFVRGRIVSGLESALGVEVDLADADLHWLSGILTIDKLAVRDPQGAAAPLLAIEHLDLDLSVAALLAGRVHAESATVSGLNVRLARSSGGAVNADSAGRTTDGATADWPEFTAWCRDQEFDPGNADWAELAEKLRAWWDSRSQARKAAAERSGGAPPPEQGGRYWEFPRTEPRFRVDSAALENARLVLEDRVTAESPPKDTVALEKIRGEIRNITSARPPDGRPLELLIIVEGLPLPALAPLYERTVPVRVAAGTASLDLSASIRDGAVDSRTTLKLSKLRLGAPRRGTTMLGLDATGTAAVIEGLNAAAKEGPLDLAVRIHGPWGELAVEWEAGLLQYARQGLQALGKKELQKHLGPLEDAAGKAGEGLKKKAADALKKGIGGLLGD